MDPGRRLAGRPRRLDIADKPSFEGWTPNYQETFAAIVSVGATLRTDDSLDMDADIDDFQEELQGIYDGADDSGG